MIGAADLVLVPLIPTVLSVRTFDQLVTFVDDAKGHKPVLRGYFSMLDRRRKLHPEILANLPTERNQVSSVAIPSASAVEQMAVRRAPLMVFAPHSPAAMAFGQLWVKIDHLGARGGRSRPGCRLNLWSLLPVCWPKGARSLEVGSSILSLAARAVLRR